MKGISRRWFILGILWPFFLGLLLLIASPLWFPRLGYYLVVSDPLAKSEAIVVLGGGDPQRVAVSVNLYRKKWAPLLITTGDVFPDYIEAMGEKLNFAELTARLLVNKGVPTESIAVINKGTSTFEEAHAIKEFAQEKKFKNVIVVTSIFHTRRTKAVYKKVFAGSGINAIIRPAEGGNFTTDRWWTREEDFLFVFEEWLKLVFYILTGKI